MTTAPSSSALVWDLTQLDESPSTYAAAWPAPGHATSNHSSLHRTDLISTNSLNAPRRLRTMRATAEERMPRFNCVIIDEGRHARDCHLTEQMYMDLKMRYPDVESVCCPICTSEPTDGPIYHCPKSEGHFLCAACFSSALFNEKCPMCRSDMPKTAPSRYYALETYIRREFKPSFACSLFHLCGSTFYTQAELETHEKTVCGWRCPVSGFSGLPGHCRAPATGCKFADHLMAHFIAYADRSNFLTTSDHEIEFSWQDGDWTCAAAKIVLPEVEERHESVLFVWQIRGMTVTAVWSTAPVIPTSVVVTAYLKRRHAPTGHLFLTRVPINSAVALNSRAASKSTPVKEWRGKRISATLPEGAIGMARTTRTDARPAYVLSFCAAVDSGGERDADIVMVV